MPAFPMGIEICKTAQGLAVIKKPGMELVIWRRTLSSDLQTWIERLDASCLPDIRVLVQPRDLHAALEPHLEDCVMPAGEMRDLLLHDIAALVTAFATITGRAWVDVRLKRVNTDACWKFHRDSVETRLLTTYRGHGTQWVQPINADQALREQTCFKGKIEQLQAHDVAIFRGSSAGRGRGIVHRSPPILGTGQTRLLLVLNLAQ
ncbi:DUF1826 domain-containing protein [Woodsholea maritima]|uniref:DUF1826 domain-containing protein n=1 Tax=Woodsholea maritima TaxID=240237 RepID=UPI00146169ED|nr:DUF1826 domain-containing protein [Woodsholea maritima]